MSAAPAPLDGVTAQDAVMTPETFQALSCCSDAALADLVRYLEILADWNGRMNLVGPSALAAFWSRHAWDSAQLLQLAPEARVWADLGAGAGFPGLVLAILLKDTPDVRIHLVESMAKRCRFLSAVADELALPAQVHNSRAEDCPLKVDIVTARACAPLPRLLGYAWPTLRRGGKALFLKGRDAPGEITEAKKSWRFRSRLISSRSDSTGHIVEVEGLSHV